MSKIKILLAATILIALVGCGNSAEETLKELLLKNSNLIDPGSVQLRNLKSNSEMTKFCGEINSKNSLGGYVGWTHFYAAGNGKSELYFKEYRNPMFSEKPYAFDPDVQEFCNNAE